MSNPATELANLLESWALSGAHPIAARGSTGDGDIVFWREQARVVGLLGEIDRALEALAAAGRPIGSFETSVPAWHRAVFSHDYAWNAGGQNGAAVPVAELSALRNFAVVLDMMGDAPALSATQRSALSEEIAAVLALLDGEISGITKIEADYVRLLAESLRDLLQGDVALDTAQLKSLIDQLNGALLGIAAELDATGDADTSRRFVSVVRNIVSATRTVAYDGAAIAAIVTAVPIVQAMLAQ